MILFLRRRSSRNGSRCKSTLRSHDIIIRCARTTVSSDARTKKSFAAPFGAIASYNVVTSQYSTLFAEQTAREKAAKTLIEELERDILLIIDDDATAKRVEEDSLEDRDLDIEFEDQL